MDCPHPYNALTYHAGVWRCSVCRQTLSTSQFTKRQASEPINKTLTSEPLQQTPAEEPLKK